MSVFRRTENGLQYSGKTYEVFFGNRHFSLTRLEELFPKLEILQKKQVHGNNIWEHGDLSESDADGLSTDKKNYGLLIKTADCIPISIASETSELIINLHAGWRGVANRILPVAIEKFKNKLKVHSWKVLIGPHISKDSFEVKGDVAKILSGSTTLGDSMVQTKPNGIFVDLEGLIANQCSEFSFFNHTILSVNEDTLSNPEYFSFRREGSAAGRMLSLIYKK